MHFQVVGASERSKSLTFVKRGDWVDFHQAGSSQNEQNFLFQTFKAQELSKAPSFVKRGKWVDLHQAGSSQKWNDVKKEFIWWCKKCCRLWSSDGCSWSVWNIEKCQKLYVFYKRGQWVDFHQASRPQKQH